MIVLKLLYFYLPVALANMAPVLFKNNFKFLAKPINEKLFGSHKTWRGIIVATIFGGLLYLLQYYLAYKYSVFNNLPFDYLSVGWWFGFVFAFLAIVGDSVKSFIKRRLNKKPGDRWIPWDQIDFLIPSTILVMIFFPFKLYYWLFIIIGIILHISVNRVCFWLKLKNTPW